MGLGNSAAELAKFFKRRDPNERFDTVIIQKDGCTIFQYFERDDENRILELIEITPLK